jgi:putative ABC transport system permease protein
VDVAGDLRMGVRGNSREGAKLLSGLVVMQVALSVMLLIGSGLLIQSFARLRSVDPGFESKNLLTAEIGLTEERYPDRQRRIQFHTSLLEKVRSFPGVTAAGMINRLPFRDLGGDTYVYPADNPPADPADRRTAMNRTVLPGYFEALEIPLLAGRVIEETDRENSPLVAVINQTMARIFFSGADPVGKRIVVDLGREVTAEIVGVVGDVRMSELDHEPRMAMYGSFFQRPHYTMRMAIRTEERPEILAPALRSAVRSMDRDVPVAELTSMQNLISHSVSDYRHNMISLTLFASAALLLASIGLYGILAYYVGQRRHEIGIRIALGAAPRRVLSMVLSRGLALVAVGIGGGIVGAVWSTSIIRQMLFGVEPADPITFVSMGLFFIAVALVASLIPAWRALRIDPVVALRAE